VSNIKPEVEDFHLVRFPREREALKPFLHAFEVSFARRRRAANTEVSFYILRPEKWVQEAFGLEWEISLFMFDFDRLQARSFQAIDQILSDDPAKNRVDPSVVLVVAPQKDIHTWAGEYLSINPQHRMYAFFNTIELTESSADQWFVRNKLASQLFSRDLFDYKLPIAEDFLFFGRDKLVAGVIDGLSRSENRGLFGLRKIGKTSVIFKVQRIWQQNRKGPFIYYDCKLPEIRRLRWDEFLRKIIGDLALALGRKARAPTTEFSDNLIALARTISERERAVIVFDEIEYISPISKLDLHWSEDFVSFWQTLWSVQSKQRSISFLIAAVNPYVTEQALFSGVQNPMFELFTSEYVHGLQQADVRSMLRFFGKRMGLTFDHDAAQYLVDAYGGHPKLIRTVGSLIHADLLSKGLNRPITITVEKIKEIENVRDFEISNYCQHIISELKEFYPEEYEMAELLACGDERSFNALAEEPAWTAHLRGYGLISTARGARPKFNFPAIARYIQNRRMRASGSQIPMRLVEPTERQGYVLRLLQQYVSQARTLMSLIKRKKLHNLFGDDIVVEPEKMVIAPVAESEANFAEFCRLVYRGCVEGCLPMWQQKSSDLKAFHPDLFEALNRIRIYRHLHQHKELVPAVQRQLGEFLEHDLGGRHPNEIPDGWFALQQRCLDGLFNASEYEISRYS